MTPPSASRVTARQIAELAGVSLATVSRVVNGRGDVADATRDHVEEIIRRQGYRTNRTPAGTANGRSGLIGVLVPLVHPAYFSSILSGAAEALQEHDMRIVLSPTGHEYAREVTSIRRMGHGVTEGALLVLPEEPSDELEALLDHGYQFVVVDPRRRLPARIPAVSATHALGADQAVQHLLELGHRRIAALTGPAGWVATEDRRRGYRAALAGAGVMPDPRLEVESDFEISGGYEAAGTVLDLVDAPTAIFAFNDNLAVGAIHAAQERGLRVPGDLSVVGFDDVEVATVVRPALTTIRAPLAEIGRMAVTLLVRLIEKQRYETLHVELSTTLVVRDSTGPVPF
jgi:LacI family transcriptional regulator